MHCESGSDGDITCTSTRGEGRRTLVNEIEANLVAVSPRDSHLLCRGKRRKPEILCKLQAKIVPTAILRHPLCVEWNTAREGVKAERIHLRIRIAPLGSFWIRRNRSSQAISIALQNSTALVFNSRNLLDRKRETRTRRDVLGCHGDNNLSVTRSGSHRRRKTP